MVSDKALDEWVASTWERPPNFGRETLIELYEEDLRKRQVKTAETREITQLKRELKEVRKRLHHIERTYLPAETIEETIAQVIAHERKEVRAQYGHSLRYKGIHQAGGQYNPGDVVTRSGSMWYCWHDTTEQPGVSDHWQLAVKAGRAGRDGKPGRKGDPGDKER